MPTTTVSITITTPAALPIADVVQDLAAYWGYQPTIGGAPNPQTRAAFIKARVAAFVREAYIAARASAAAELARLQAVAESQTVTTD